MPATRSVTSASGAHTTRTSLNYERMRCRICGAMIGPDLDLLQQLGRRRAAATRADCIYRCDCGASYSNAARPAARVLITASPELNVPEPVRPAVTSALDKAVNQTNLVNKRSKFCFETSEDAVTWTVFNGLRQAGRLGAIVPNGPHGKPELLLWGAALVEGGATPVATELRRVSMELGEDPRRLTEPDAILAWDELLVFVEAKYRSPNDEKPGYGNFALYTNARPDLFSVQGDEVAAAGYYELTRNWRIGVQVAERLGVPEFLLVNLGGKALAESATAFAAMIQQTTARRFCHRRWAEVLETASPLEPWLADYVRNKKLAAR
jgi:hypothetical protein